MIDIYKITKEEIQGLSGEDFENLVLAWYEAIGLSAMKTPKTGDYGADVIVESHIGKIAIQCKRQTATVGIKAVQEIFAATRKYGANSAKIITSSGFSANAVELAKHCGVELINGEMFWESFILPVQNDEFIIKEKKRYIDELNKLEAKANEYNEFMIALSDEYDRYKDNILDMVIEHVNPYITDFNKKILELNSMIASTNTNSELSGIKTNIGNLNESINVNKTDVSNELHRIKKVMNFAIAVSIISVITSIALYII